MTVWPHVVGEIWTALDLQSAYPQQQVLRCGEKRTQRCPYPGIGDSVADEVIRASAPTPHSPKHVQVETLANRHTRVNECRDAVFAAHSPSYRACDWCADLVLLYSATEPTCSRHWHWNRDKPLLELGP